MKFSSICVYSARRSAAKRAVSLRLAALILSYSALAADTDSSRREMSPRRSSTRFICRKSQETGQRHVAHMLASKTENVAGLLLHSIKAAATRVLQLFTW